MKQTTKRFYGTLACVAFFSGLTGAFAFSVSQKARMEAEALTMERTEDASGFMKLANTPGNATSIASQPVDLTVAAEKACNAVVYIKCLQTSKTQTIEYQDPFADFFGDFFGRGGTQRRQVQTPKKESAGSGVIISGDGYIVTNNHVVEGADEITITLNDNREFTAKVVGTDPDTDLALLKIDDAKDLTPIVIGDSDNLKVGEWVLAVGNPFNLTSTVTAGIVSAKARNLGANRNGIESFIQTDAAINAGNSGGALVNTRGELVGINAMLYSQTGSFTGYGFAIPVNIMKKIVTDLKSYGTVQRALLGVSGSSLLDYIDAQKSKDSKYKPDFGTNDGVYVADVTEGGAAEEAGIKSGDIIIAVNNKKITKMSELQEATTKFRPGDKAEIKFLRDKKEKTVTVTFRNAKGNTNVVKNSSIEELGAEFKELTDSQKKTLNMRYGVQVTKLKKGLLKSADMPEGFIIMKINNQDMKSKEDIEKVFKAAQASDEQTLWIWGKTPAGVAMSFAILLSE